MGKCATGKKTMRRYAGGGMIDAYGNDLTRSNQMGAVANTLQQDSMARNAAPAQDPMVALGGAIAAGLRPQQPAGPAPLSTGSSDLDTLGTAQGSAPKFALQTMAEKAVAAGRDPNASSIPTFKARGGMARNSAPVDNPRNAPVQNMVTPVDQLFGQRGFENGGVIADAMKRREQEAGLTTQAPPVAQTPPPPPPPTADALDTAARIARANAATKPKGLLSKLGFANGGKIKGPGTPTSDSIAAEVKGSGEPIKVSTGERIVSKAQDGYLQEVAQQMGFDSLDAMLEHGTGKPVGPTVKGGMAHAVNGAQIIQDGVVTGVKNARNVNWVDTSRQLVPYSAPAAAPAAPGTSLVPAGELNTGPLREPVSTTRRPIPAEPYKPNWTAPKQTAVVPYSAPAAAPIEQAVGKGVAHNAGRATASMYQAAGGLTGIAGKALNIVAPAMAAYQTIGDYGIRVEGAREKADLAEEEAASGLPRATATAKELALRAGDWGTKGLDILGGWALPKSEASFNDAYRSGVGQLDGVSAPTSNAASPATQPAQSTYSNEGRGMRADQSINAQMQAVAARQRATNAPGFVGEQMIDDRNGGYMVSGKATGDIGKLQAPEGGGFAQMGGKTIFVPGGMAQQAIAGPKDGYGNDMTRTNQMKAELAGMERARYTRDMQSDIKDPRVIALGMANIARLNQQQAAQQSAEGAGMTRQVQQQQIAIGANTLQQHQQEAADLAEMNDAKTTPERRALLRDSLLAKRGKEVDTGKFMTHSVDSFDPQTGMKNGQKLISTNTRSGEARDVTNGGGQAASAPPEKERQVGKVYQTPKGPMTWRGNGWEASK